MRILSERKLTEAPSETTVRLNFRQGGFERDKSSDFSDDGTRFYAYKHQSGLPMTYARHQDQVFIALRPDYLNSLNYSEYSTLPSYKNVDIYNGVLVSEVDMKKLDGIATQFMKEYNNKVSEVEGEDYEEDWKKYVEEATKYNKFYYEEAKQFVMNNFDKFIHLKSYDMRDAMYYLQFLEREANKDWTRYNNNAKFKRNAVNTGFEKRSERYYERLVGILH